MKDFVCFPEIKRTACGQRIYNEVTSAEWFETAFNNSPATANGKLIPGSLFVGLCNFDDKSCIDKLMKVSEHPFLMSFLNLPLEARKRPVSWCHVALLPDIEVSDLEKEVSNPKLAMKRLMLYHKCSAFLHESFQDPKKAHPMWVHGLGMTNVYFQLAMIIGDTEQQNKICGIRGGNGMFRRHCCRDCSVRTYKCDNPKVLCQRRQVSDAKVHLEWIFDNANNLPPPSPSRWVESSHRREGNKDEADGSPE